MSKKNIIAEMDAFFEFMNDGIIDINAAADRLNVKVGDIDEAFEAWNAVMKGEKASRKGTLCVGRVAEGMRKLF